MNEIANPTSVEWRSGRFVVREASSADIEIILAFVHKKADFDRTVGSFSGRVEASAERFALALFGNPVLAYSVILETEGKAIGFSFFYFRFSSFAGRPSLWMDDLYIDAGQRGAGGGRCMMQGLGRLADRRNCTHLAWCADDRNVPGMRFYHNLGATIIDQKGHCVFWQMTPDVLINGSSSRVPA